MKSILLVVQMLCAFSICGAQPSTRSVRAAAEYYVAVYAKHYGVPVALARAVVERESSWQPCTVSLKGAVGLMQLMPETAKRLGVASRCDLNQNVSGGVRHLAWLMQRFHNDFRLVVAAYYAGEDVIERRGLAYRNDAVVTYVKTIRAAYSREIQSKPESKTPEKRDVR